MSRTPSPSALSVVLPCSSNSPPAPTTPSPNRSTKTSLASTRSECDVQVVERSGASSFTRGLGRFFRGGSAKQDSIDSSRSDDGGGRSPGGSRPSSPTVNRPKSPSKSRSKRLAGFASRQLPKLTLRHPSIDSAAMPLPIDVEDAATSSSFDNDFLQIRRNTRRRWTDSDTSGRLRDSHDSSDFHDDSHDTLDVGPAHLGGPGGPSDTNQSMTAPVSPNVPLSASSSHSDGWKYSSQKLLWKLKPRYINFSSHASSTSSSTDSAWKSLDSMTWRSVDGAEVILRGTRLETLSEIERGALQSVAVQRLVKLLPGVNFGKPKDALSALRQKRQKLVKTTNRCTPSEAQRRASGTPLADEKRVFGVSLATCMLNERRLDQESRCRSLDDSTVCMMNHRGKAVAKPVKSEPEMHDNRKWLYPSTHNLYPCSSSPTSPSPTTISHHLLTADGVEQIRGRFAKKTRPVSASFSCSLDASSDDVDPHALQVPRIVENCTQYLMAYGMNQVGLFRVAGNTKRCRRLRNALEKAGGGTAINDTMVENTTAHDVATLLKEYFRDLPQSLLPREHYQGYIAAAKLSVDDRVETIRLLFALLVSPNLDTLFVLLKFLHEVTAHSQDRDGVQGMIHGNKMDARNLATIFAPSILRADHEKLQETLAENEQQITVVETMITNVEEIFKIPKELQCKIYTRLRETEPDRLDRILNYLCKLDSHDHVPPLSATAEETDCAPPLSPRIHHRHSDHSHIGRQSPLAIESKSSSSPKLRVQSQRSGSWPFSLNPPDTATTSTTRFFANEHGVTRQSDSGRASDFCSDEMIEVMRARSETVSTAKKPVPMIAKLAGTTTSKSVDARSPSRERVDTLRTAARSGAQAARRRLRNVVRAFRLTTVHRSSPDISS